jgi:hypothetical protein
MDLRVMVTVGMAEGSESDSDGTPINKKNLLKKLGFIRFGNSSDDHFPAFREELVNRSAGSNLVTRQAVYAWFDKNSSPSKGRALDFLHDYFSTAIKYEELTEDQKKVYQRVRAFFRGRSGSSPATLRPRHEARIVGTKNGVFLPFQNELSELEALTAAAGGTFIAYRKRFNEDPRRPISREVLRVFRWQRELRFELWYLREDAQVDCFEGVVVPIGHVLWFFGAAAAPPSRLRIMHFRYTRTANEKLNNLKWGIASSDIPTPSSPDPASARICAIRQKAVNLSEGFIREKATYIGPDTLANEPHGSVIERLIDNNITALSGTRSVLPAHDDVNNRIVDTVLKVNQTTAESAAEAIFDTVDWARDAL